MQTYAELGFANLPIPQAYEGACQLLSWPTFSFLPGCSLNSSLLLSLQMLLSILQIQFGRSATAHAGEIDPAVLSSAQPIVSRRLPAECVSAQMHQHPLQYPALLV